MRRPQFAILGLLLAAALVLGVSIFATRKPKAANIPQETSAKLAGPLPQSIQRMKIAESASTNPKAAEKQYEAFVEANERSKNRRVQDEVGKARIGIAYIRAGQKDFSGARAVLQEAVAQYRGTGLMEGQFGGVKDEAAYQAAVCLVGEGKTDGAREALIAFLKQYPLSPLAEAAYRRLVRLNGGKATAEYEHLVQDAITHQEKRAKFEVASCGPRALAYLIPLVLGTRPSRSQPEAGAAAEPSTNPTYEELAKLCGTTEKGTSMEGMRHALQHYGIASYGYQLNAADFRRLATPALLLRDGHFVVLTKIADTWIEVYDPMEQSGNRKVLALSAADDPKFQANVLALSPVPVSAEAGAPDGAVQPKTGIPAADANKAEAEKRQKQIAIQKKNAEAQWAAIKAKEGKQP